MVRTHSIEHIVYPSYGPAGGVVVNRLSVQGLWKYGSGICDLILNGYSANLEGKEGPLPPGTVALRYGPEHGRAFTKRAIDAHDNGSQYWVIALAGRRVAGFIKTTPGEFLTTPEPNAVYINDVVVRTGEQKVHRHQRKGYATALLHAALTYGNYGLGRALSLEAFLASEDYPDEEGRLVAGPNSLYRHMGLEVAEPSDPFKFPNGYELFMHYYRSPAKHTLGSAIKALEARKPALRKARPVFERLLS